MVRVGIVACSSAAVTVIATAVITDHYNDNIDDDNDYEDAISFIFR